MRLAFGAVAALVFSTLCGAQTFDVKSVPNPRLKNRWCSDEARVFSAQEKSQLESILSTINQATRAEVVLVTLPSIGERVPKDFAVDLFNDWKLGQRGRDNGLLVLLVTDQRRMEMETGYGLEGTLPDVVLSRIQRELIVPALKEGRIGVGFIRGLQKIAEILEKESRSNPSSQPSAPSTPSSSGRMFDPPKNLAIFFLLPLLILFSLSLLNLLVAFVRSDPLWRYRWLKKNFGFLFFWQLMSLVFFFEWILGAVASLSKGGGPVLVHIGLAILLGLGVAVLWSRLGKALRDNWGQRLRRQPRRCPYCHETMTCLDGQSEKRYEKPQEVVEEQISSMDYDVWVCSQGHVRKDGYEGTNRYQYSECETCHALAKKLIQREVLEKPTSSKPGQGVNHFQCLACRKTSDEKYAIYPRSSSGSGGSSSRGGGGSSGGGSSGGGGAGSSY